MTALPAGQIVAIRIGGEVYRVRFEDLVLALVVITLEQRQGGAS